MDSEIDFEAYSNLTQIQSFFHGQSVFLTGVTGLVGKVVLEKLLRCCPGIGMVYILVRPKKGLSTEQRLKKLFELELFNELKKVFPLFWKRVQVVEGDITQNRLGLSFEDYEKIRQNVTIVIHSAASVQFNDPLKIAVNSNLKSTKILMDMCHDMPNVKSIVHVSTAFVKREPDGSVLEEVPKPKIKPQVLLDAMEWMDENTQNALCDFLTDKKLTTYLVTKAFAEALIEDERGDLPIALVRPTYISSTYSDPFPGWIDTIQGLSGLLLAGAKGVLRALVSIKGLKVNVIPVDFVTNAIIASAWHVGTTRPPQLFIINTVLNYEKLPDADEQILKIALAKRDEYPLANMFRYPHFTIYYNEYAYQIHALIDQWIPAVIIDFLLLIFTGRTVLFKIYAKINFLYGIFHKLGREPWICRMDNYYFLKDKLSEEDAKIFQMDTDNLDWMFYIDNCLKGGRKYIAREDPSNIPYARKKAYIWWLVTTILKWFMILLFLYYLFTRSFFKSFYENVEEKVHAIYS